MKNVIRSQVNGEWKIWKRRSKNLKSGEIQCPRCGKWVKVSKFQDKHFNEEYQCRSCNKEVNAEKPSKTTTQKPNKNAKKEIGWAENCPHKPFFKCKE